MGPPDGYAYLKRITDTLLVSFGRPNGRRYHKDMEPQWGGEKSLTAAGKNHTLTDRVCTFKTIGAECRDQKKCRHRANGGVFSLDIHSYRTLIGRFYYVSPNAEKEAAAASQ